ncbi:MAG: excinuclease ABC subunit UvrA [Planctomycetaceae bacterium]
MGTRTEVLDYLRILFARAGSVFCPTCNTAAVCMTADSAAAHLLQRAAGCRAMLVFRAAADADVLADLLSAGFSRGIVGGRTMTMDDAIDELRRRPDSAAGLDDEVLIVADRIRIDSESSARLAESLEAVFGAADGHCIALIEPTSAAGAPPDSAGEQSITVDERSWRMIAVSQHLACLTCGRTFDAVSAEQLNFQSPLGACPTCEGTGQVSGMSFEKVVPDDSVSLKDGAIQPWTTPAYRHELDELLELAPDYGVPVHVPFAALGEHHRRLIQEGVPERSFGGLNGFHRWLVRNRYKQGVSVFLNRWRSWLTCTDCGGSRLTSSAGSVQLNQQTLTTASAMELRDLQVWLTEVSDQLSADLRKALSPVMHQLTDRLRFLNDSGLQYLSLDRSLKTLSGGEAQRVALTAALGSGLINTLYVLDEPTSGLHPSDTARIIQATRNLQRQGNTVVVVEHDPDFIQAADEVVEIGPQAGAAGGEVVFQGTVPQLIQNSATPTGLSLQAIRASVAIRHEPRSPQRWLQFSDVHCHNISGLSGRVPLGVICMVTGVSGCGKSSLLVDALYPALCRQLKQPCDPAADGRVGGIVGTDQLAAVSLLDQSPLRGSRRSIPATTIGCFDDIRAALAETHEAKKRNYKPGMFSFNSAQGGRCPNCEGHGVVTVEMQFLADIQTTCEACDGKRFRPDVLDVRYRDRSIHDILQMTADDAFTFFNGRRKIQQKLNALRQAGLGYLRIGQPVATLSGGEAQRLRIATLLAGFPLDDAETVPTSNRKAAIHATTQPGGTLFLLDEPSTGLHLQDIAALMTCLNHLIDIGHSVIVIEHDREMIRHADYVIELGPGPGRDGGQIIAEGPPNC